MAEDFVDHAWPPPDNGKAKLRAATARMGKALDQISFRIDDLIGEDDRVCVRLTASARQIGEIHIFRLRDGLIVEHWHELDAMGLMRQLKGD